MYIDTILKQDITKAKRPKRVQDIIPIDRIYANGMAKHNNRYSMMYALKDIDFENATAAGQDDIADRWAGLLDSLDPTGSTLKITICNHRIKKKELMNQTLLPIDYYHDGFDNFRIAYNRLRYDDLEADQGYTTDKYLTFSVNKKDAAKAESFFNRLTRDLNLRLQDMDSAVYPMSAEERLEVLYGFLQAGREDEYNYEYTDKNAKGEFKTHICPEYIQFFADHFKENDKVGRAMMIKTLGGNIPGDFLSRLSEVKTDLMLSVDIIPLSKAVTKKLIERKDDDVENSADQWSSSKKVQEGSAIRLPRHIKKDRKVIDEYIEDVDERHQKTYLVQILCVFLADTKELLEEYTDSIREAAGEATSQMSILYFEQYDGFQDAIPFGVRTIENLRDCNTDTASILLPFSHAKLNHNTGIPYGKHEGTKEQQMIDRRLLVNGNEWILGTSGSGKSTNAKLKLVYEALLTDGDIVVVDPDGEYTPLISGLGGQVIHVGQDSINIMDISSDYGDEIDPVQKKSDMAITFCESVLDSGTTFGESEKSLIDKAVKTLSEAVLRGAATYFTLEDVYDLLRSYGMPQADNLALALERHITGSFNCFAKPTSININSRIICYDLSLLSEQMKNAGMLVVLDSIDHRLITNRYRGIATYIKLDEVDYFFQHAASANVLGDFFQRARKYGGFITAIIQNISNMLQNKTAYKMINNAANVIMLKQAATDAKILMDMYGLSSAQYKKLIKAQRGHGINKIEDDIYAFDGTIPEDNELYRFIDTTVVKAG